MTHNQNLRGLTLFESCDFVIPLGKGRFDDGRLKPASILLLDEAARLYKESRAGKIIVVGGKFGSFMDKVERFAESGASVRTRYLMEQHNILKDDIILVERGRDTLNEIIGVSAYLQQRQSQDRPIKPKCVFVTTREHIERVRLIANRFCRKDKLCLFDTRSPSPLDRTVIVKYDLNERPREKVLRYVTARFLREYFSTREQRDAIRLATEAELRQLPEWIALCMEFEGILRNSEYSPHTPESPYPVWPLNYDQNDIGPYNWEGQGNGKERK